MPPPAAARRFPRYAATRLPRHRPSPFCLGAGSWEHLPAGAGRCLPVTCADWTATYYSIPVLLLPAPPDVTMPFRAFYWFHGFPVLKHYLLRRRLFCRFYLPACLPVSGRHCNTCRAIPPPPARLPCKLTACPSGIHGTQDFARLVCLILHFYWFLPAYRFCRFPGR